MSTKEQDKLYWEEFFKEVDLERLSPQKKKWLLLNDSKQVERITRAYNFDGKKVLSGCCGVGWFERLLLRKEPSIKEVVGLDLSTKAIKTAVLGEAPSNLSFVVGDMEALPFPNDYFDVCLILSGLHHIPNSQVALKEARRVSNSLILLEPNSLNPLRKLIELRLASKVKETSFYKWELLNWLSQLNYPVVKAFSIFYVGWLPNWVPRKLLGLVSLLETCPIVRHVLGGHLIVARKDTYENL